MIGTIAVSVIGLVHKVERVLLGENRLLMIRGEKLDEDRRDARRETDDCM
jgi:hypothetical protein